MYVYGCMYMLENLQCDLHSLQVNLSLLNTIELCSLFMYSGAVVISLTVWPRVTKL